VFHIPFYVVAPETTIDPRTPDGSAIPIEHRAPEEVRQFRDSLAAPPGCEVYNPAFDVTPGDWITGIITDKTVHRSPYQLNRP
jgi:methylthioribose-1-phosphate isomerase